MKWYFMIIFIIIASVLMTGFIWSMEKVDSDQKGFAECDNSYDEGDCLLYQCKLNYSLSIETSNLMYGLYHNCIINDACVLDSVGGEDGK